MQGDGPMGQAIARTSSGPVDRAVSAPRGAAPRRLVLKVDVDTLRGTREGVPRLIEAMKRRGVGATFLFSLGPDHTGWTIKRIFRPGFLSKVSRTSAIEHYGVTTLMYGLLLPGPDIGARAAAEIKATGAAGFETGLHAWDHVKWHDAARRADDAWTAREWHAAAARYRELFGSGARVAGAAGWQINEMTVRLQAASGIQYASDGRGPRPTGSASTAYPSVRHSTPPRCPPWTSCWAQTGWTRATSTSACSRSRQRRHPTCPRCSRCMQNSRDRNCCPASSA
jgi:peptidoglycan/xylan/chitin deacetylase (PgdA/CDA1 family)